MPDEKDRLGDKLRDVERAREDQYFAKRDKELIEKLRSQRDEEFRSELEAAGTMLCPRCRAELEAHQLQGIEVDECANCGGMWLDKGEFETIAKREEEGWFGRLLRARLDAKR